MNVLLIEDDKEKAKSVISFLRKEYPNVALNIKSRITLHCGKLLTIQTYMI